MEGPSGRKMIGVGVGQKAVGETKALGHRISAQLSLLSVFASIGHNTGSPSGCFDVWS